MSCEVIRDHGAPYALGALDPAERDALDEHVRRCPPCARELDELQQVTAQLAQALPQQEPPPALGERILAAARAETVGDAETRGRGDAGTDLDAGMRGRGDAEIGGDTGMERHGEDFFPASPRPRVSASRGRWLPLAALAAALAALIWGASVQLQLSATRQQLAETSGQLDRIRNAYNTVIDVLASSAMQERDLQAREGAPDARGKIWVDHATGRGMMMARDLPPLPEGQIYQVWLSNAESRVSGGFLRPYEHGVYYVVLQTPDPLTSYQTVGVTREPQGGSREPTGPRIIGGEF